MNSVAYQKCKSAYGWIVDYNIRYKQQEHYKVCSHFAIWYNTIKGNPVELIFFKDYADYKVQSGKYRHLVLHYSEVESFDCPPNCTKEEITDLVIKAIMTIFDYTKE